MSGVAVAEERMAMAEHRIEMESTKRGKWILPLPVAVQGIRVGDMMHVGRWPPVVYGHRRVTICGVTRARTSDRCERLSGASG
jgi:hypothetical protein